jgi:hypothetical protein
MSKGYRIGAKRRTYAYSNPLGDIITTIVNGFKHLFEESSIDSAAQQQPEADTPMADELYPIPDVDTPMVDADTPMADADTPMADALTNIAAFIKIIVQRMFLLDDAIAWRSKAASKRSKRYRMRAARRQQQVDDAAAPPTDLPKDGKAPVDPMDEKDPEDSMDSSDEYDYAE